jgi:hypothetical protein
MANGESDSFVEYRRLFLAELEHNRQAVKELGSKLDAAMTQMAARFDTLHQNDISQIKVNIAMLQVRCSIYGGLVGGGVAFLTAWLKSH